MGPDRMPVRWGTVNNKVIGRAAILTAARETLVEAGVSALTVRAVAQRAGCSTTGIYTYFGGKQGVLDALYAEAFAAFHGALYGGLGKLGPMAAIHRAAREHREWALANPTQYLLIFAFRASGYTPSKEVVAPTSRTFEAAVEMVETAVATGNLSGDARVIATHLWATEHGFLMLELTGPGTLSHDPVGMYVEGVNASLRAHGAVDVNALASSDLPASRNR